MIVWPMHHPLISVFFFLVGFVGHNVCLSNYNKEMMKIGETRQREREDRGLRGCVCLYNLLVIVREEF